MHDDAVTPKLHVIFAANNQRIIFNAAIDWDDTIFIAYRLIQELAQDFDHLKLLAPEVRDRLNIKEYYGDRVAKRISDMRKDLDIIQENLLKLGFGTDDFDTE